MQAYNGVNLIVGDLNTNKVAYTTNRGRDDKQPQELSPGLYGLSNGVLGDKWVKVSCRAIMATLNRSPFSKMYLQVLDIGDASMCFTILYSHVLPTWSFHHLDLCHPSKLSVVGS